MQPLLAAVSLQRLQRAAPRRSSALATTKATRAVLHYDQSCAACTTAAQRLHAWLVSLQAASTKDNSIWPLARALATHGHRCINPESRRLTKSLWRSP